MSSRVLPPDDTRGPQVLAASWTTEALAVLAVGLRLHVRIKAHSIGWDDYFICLALVRLSLALMYSKLIIFPLAI